MLVFVTWIDSLLTQRWSVLHNVHQFTSHSYQASFLNTLVLHWTIIQGTSSPSVIVPNPSLHPPCWIVNRRKRICESACKVASLNPSSSHPRLSREISVTYNLMPRLVLQWVAYLREVPTLSFSICWIPFLLQHTLHSSGWNCSRDIHYFRSRKKVVSR